MTDKELLKRIKKIEKRLNEIESEIIENSIGIGEINRGTMRYN